MLEGFSPVRSREVVESVAFLLSLSSGEAMRTAGPQDVTQLLLAWGQGEKAALEKLIPLMYKELHRLARGYMGRERSDHTLQTTALVNEAYLRLVDASKIRWQNRAHFLAISAQVMRRVLVEMARSRQCLKRGGEAQKISLDEAPAISEEKNTDLAALDDALNELAIVDPRKSRVVELRFFGGLSTEETAQVLNVSPDTVLRDWKLAKVWLMREVKKVVTPR
jgi:RNA polymerase sigma factor (TIGR02999 family)